MKTRRGGLSFRKSSSPRRPRTLVALLERDISRTDDTGPDWPTVVEDAVLDQDMQWVEESLAGTAPQRQPGREGADHLGAFL